MSAFAEGTPTATVKLGGKEYTLGFTLAAMRRAKELNVLDVDVTDRTALMLVMPEYVWVCLPEEARNELSVATLSELMNPANIGGVMDAIGQLFKSSLPKEEPGKNGEPAAVKEPTAGNSTLSNSGQLESTISV